MSNENNSSAPLLPCPFCGASAALQNESPADNSGGYFVECNSCGASTNLRYACGDDPVPLIVAQWNARAPQAVAAQAAPAAVAVSAKKLASLVEELRMLAAVQDPEYQNFQIVMEEAAKVLENATPALPATEDSSAGHLAAVQAELVALPDVAYTALQFVEGQLAAIANRQFQNVDVLEPVDTIAKAAKRAKAALLRLQSVAHHFDTAPQPQPAFQQRVQPWMMECFGPEISADRIERNHRFLEEALELVQATGCTQSEAHQLVDYVFGRPVGDPAQEVGGVMVTLAALCLANGLDMHHAGDTELARVWTKVEAIRAKQAAKPKHSPLPQAQAQPADAKVQWWLAELDRYGNPALTDGAHGDRAGADRAAYLIESMGLGKGRKFAVARVELTKPVPNSSGVNHEAVAQINRAAMAAAQEGGKA